MPKSWMKYLHQINASAISLSVPQDSPNFPNQLRHQQDRQEKYYTDSSHSNSPVHRKLVRHISILQCSLDDIVYRKIKAVESLIIQFRETAYQGLQLRHHIRLRLLPFAGSRPDSVNS